MFKNLQKHVKGFTLLEVVISLGLLIMVFGSITSLAILGSEAERSAKNNLIASYLAQEAQNMVRYERDLNYILAVDPFTNLAIETDNTNYNFIISYDGSIASAASSDVKVASPLQIAGGLYSQSAGTATIFHRLVTTTYHVSVGALPTRIDVKVEVYWKQDTKSNTYTLTSELLNSRLSAEPNCTNVNIECSHSCAVGSVCGGGTVIDSTNYIVASRSNCTDATTCDDGTDTTTLQWALDGATTGATDAADGRTNVTTLQAIDPTLASFPAVKFCDDLNINGFNTWYLPAYNELGAADFAYIGGHLPGIADSQDYWSSSEDGSFATNADQVNMCSGGGCAISLGGTNKTSSLYVRCTRRY